MKFPSLPMLLSFNGRYVDTLGFLSLSGLFTAHVTGNFVTLGATAALGLGGALSKLLALPVFCLVVFLSRLVCLKLKDAGHSPIRPMLLVKLALFTGIAIYAVYHGPFHAEESTVTLLVGMALVSAMAIQNGLHKSHLAKAPPLDPDDRHHHADHARSCRSSSRPEGRGSRGSQGADQKDGRGGRHLRTGLRCWCGWIHVRACRGLQPARHHSRSRSFRQHGRR